MDRLLRSKNGFSLVEMVVALAVMGIILAMSLASFPRMRDQISLTLATRELALNLRKAQSYAIAVREFNASNTANLCRTGYVQANDGFVRYPPYGVAVAKQNDSNGNDEFTYSIFGDINCNAFLLQFPIYQSASEKVDSVKIQNGVRISEIRGYSGSGSNALRYAQIVYQRPNPSVTLIGTTQGGGGVTGIYAGKIEITLTSNSGTTQKIILTPTGQISIQ